MIIEQILGNLKDVEVGYREIETIHIEWFEANKRIQRYKTDKGTELAIRFLKEGQRLSLGDILYMDDKKAIVVDIIPAEAIQITPHSMLEMGSICYEIGNKHLPVFIQDNLILIPFEDPIFKWLNAVGYHAKKVTEKLDNIVSLSAHGPGQGHGHSHDHDHDHSHGHSHAKTSIFSKIMGLK